jgi:nitrate reductase assembly molybdenum cofactor insertion protein NarJ
MCSLPTHLPLFISFLSALPSFFTGNLLAIYRVSYSVAALRVDVDLPHSY